ncbi:hypothetical protein [Pseudooceanicola nanhaiensis]|uniref:hypothetical protein n=1 Tax=Pseudooceanicola nanhaiensis TaxID=375761 RepID=UPI001CD46698|nr:hypothetical protein [Pseudooceanicola nanhaiensis]MCA0921222.1 hypothetical protein [Pseudooceanicola nanhaiensis]
MVGKVLSLSQREQIGVDPLRLDQLYGQLGETGAEEVICRAMEELALRLTRAERMYRQGHLTELRKGARALAAIADQIGMTGLSLVADDVKTCVDTGDTVALAAVIARLMRVGEGSLTEVWDMQDLSL